MLLPEIVRRRAERVLSDFCEARVPPQVRRPEVLSAAKISL